VIDGQTATRIPRSKVLSPLFVRSSQELNHARPEPMQTNNPSFLLSSIASVE